MTKLYAYLSCDDTGAAKAWLGGLGFEITGEQKDEEDQSIHAEMKRGDAAVMIAPPDKVYEPPRLNGRSTGHGLYLLVDDVPAVYAAALEGSGTSIFEPEQTEWGTERA